MFGAFKPSAPLSGGLLWKIPWRLSSTRKLRQRRRLRRVDNVVSVLDSALKKSTSTQSQPQPQSEDKLPPSAAGTGATKADLQTTAEGQRLLSTTNTPTSQSTRRHGRGPLQGEFLPTSTPIPAQTPTGSITLQRPSSIPLLTRDSNTIKLIARWKAEMPTEQEMLPRDKYTMFDKKVRGYRKGVHKLPKWTRVSQRVNPPGF
ncbi:hypothetical protein M409DRAFT_30119 [Zasmidium cellare ATCC 36951]|uniref:54S ribosomal protein L31, mitochondrial n=1 Tax=Zasmidium cellare ATCC 36951 TaxID=1080233 RepID=A0A6A6C0P0_ZASCE|nr:uncharacterized protein M409DRAFT_30119 [Zasmidium cellare ATCC 36951]KAF2159369.1 hypothetical protein M409DRAFT_30119 [Zasmidium cellare ATCC 36951]